MSCNDDRLLLMTSVCISFEGYLCFSWVGVYSFNCIIIWKCICSLLFEVLSNYSCFQGRILSSICVFLWLFIELGIFVMVSPLICFNFCEFYSFWSEIFCNCCGVIVHRFWTVGKVADNRLMVRANWITFVCKWLCCPVFLSVHYHKPALLFAFLFWFCFNVKSAWHCFKTNLLQLCTQAL